MLTIPREALPVWCSEESCTVVNGEDLDGLAQALLAGDRDPPHPRAVEARLEPVVVTLRPDGATPLRALEGVPRGRGAPGPCWHVLPRAGDGWPAGPVW